MRFFKLMKKGTQFFIIFENVFIGMYGSMKNLYHPWKLSIAQTIFYSEKIFLIKMFSRLWWKGLFVEPKMVQIKIPEVSLFSLFLQQKQRNLWNLNISDYRLTDSPDSEQLLVNETHCEKVGWPEYVHFAVLKLFT